MIDLAQQARLPAVPDLGPDRADVGGGQHQEQLQPLGRLHLRREILDRLGIVDVALEGGVAHKEVPAHQPRHRLGLLVGETQAPPELLRDAFAQDRVVAAAALGDVVQQHREEERAARVDGRHDRGRERQLVLELPRLDVVQDADREDRVLVDRVVVVHVVLHLRDHAAEIRHEAAEDAGLVHAPERGRGILARGQDLHEEPVRLRIGAQLRIDQLQRLGDEPKRMRVDVEPVLVGDMEEPDQRDGIVAEGGVGGDVEPVALDRKTVYLLLE